MKSVEKFFTVVCRNGKPQVDIELVENFNCAKVTSNSETIWVPFSNIACISFWGLEDDKVEEEHKKEKQKQVTPTKLNKIK